MSSRPVATPLYGVVATFQSDDNSGRVLAAYVGIFVAGPTAWGGRYSSSRA